MDALISPRRRTLLLGAFGTAALAACERPGLRPNAGRVHLSGETMGSTWNAKLDLAGQPVDRIGEALRAALGGVDERMSRFRPESELCAFNSAAAGVPVPLSAELFAVLAAAQDVSRWSDGAFDVTVAPAVETWGFGVHKRRRVPAPEQVALQRAKVDWRALKLDKAHRTATKGRQGLQVDLGGIAKGYGVDVAAGALEGLGIAHYMIEAGGEVRTKGVNAAGEPWQIGIEEPDALPPRARHIVPLSGRAMATSGDYRLYFEQDGRRYSHEIDPATVAPIAHRLCSVTVVAGDCMTADALATALIVLGPDRAYAIADAGGIAAQFIERVGPRRFTDRMTSAFAALGARPAA
ncbi:MAG TPA: FAD:protein FMN transferase [Burkholderiaceae bacterium]|nr:FAD:protein FMN transferase [Burkholderiaceae bacterium]